MSALNQTQETPRYSVFEPAEHSLHECRGIEEFLPRFEAITGCPARNVADGLVATTVPKAIFLVGSLTLGMATAGSDVDFIVMVGSSSDLLVQSGGGIVNSDQRFAFINESDVLMAGAFLTLMNGLAVEVRVAIAPNINRIQARLRGRGPELNENEIMTLSRLSKGWLVSESPGFLQSHSLRLQDPALDVYCSTRTFVDAEIFRRKADKVLDLGDIPLALHLGRASVENAYVAYFASEGYSYLGQKWLAQIGHAYGAAERVSRHPLLKRSLHLLFPRYESSREEAAQYLRAVSDFLHSMRELIEEKTLFRIAFHACPQIHDIPRGRAG
jgi:hypothetical protein